MSQRQEQTQIAKQEQQMSALQVALSRLLELPVAEMKERVENEMLDNGALETADEEREDDREATADDEAGIYGDEAATDASAAAADELADYSSADDVPDYLLRRAETREEARELPLGEQTSFYEALRQQIREHSLTERQQELMEYLIGSLDEDGFLRKDCEILADELAIYNNVHATPDELRTVLHVLQRFEPRGIGAKDLQECLQLQLEDPEHLTPVRQAALDVVRNYYRDFVSKHWDELQRKLHTDDETFGKIISELRRLNPMPGSALNDSVTLAAPTVIPDFYVAVDDEGGLSVELNNGDVPELRVGRSFLGIVKEYAGHSNSLTKAQRDAYVYARQKVEAAQSFINLVQRRQHTLLAVMRAIVRLQRPFFAEGDDETLLQPMNLKNVAAEAGVDISTVSRVTASKYVQTRFGMYPLRYFFALQFTNEDGEALDVRKAKAKLRELIESEDRRRPYSDDRLAALMAEAGMPIARRTIAKYRDQMNIPVARLRK
ncbi:MAG: RNA polymerase factor sigma-54 [Alloprevotella sp.]